MQFYKESINTAAQMYYRWYADEKSRLKNAESKENNILWEIGNTVESDKIRASFGSKHHIILTISPLTSAEFIELMDDTIELAESYGYFNVSEEEDENILTFKHEELQTIQISFQANECKLIHTGKLIPEQKKICKFTLEE